MIGAEAIRERYRRLWPLVAKAIPPWPKPENTLRNVIKRPRCVLAAQA